MNREQRIVTLNLHGWRPVRMNVYERAENGDRLPFPALGMTKEARFAYPKWMQNSQRLGLGVKHLVGPTTAIEESWDVFEDEELRVLMLWATGATSGQAGNGGYVPPQ